MVFGLAQKLSGIVWTLPKSLVEPVCESAPKSLLRVARPQLFKRWIALSTGWVTIQRISIRETNCAIQWIVIYPVDSVIHLLYNWGQICTRIWVRAIIYLLKAIVRFANQVEGTFETHFQLFFELFGGPKQGFSALWEPLLTRLFSLQSYQENGIWFSTTADAYSLFPNMNSTMSYCTFYVDFWLYKSQG